MRKECIIISIQWVQGFSFVIWDGEVGSCVICRTKVLVISEMSHISAAARTRSSLTLGIYRGPPHCAYARGAPLVIES